MSAPEFPGVSEAATPIYDQLRVDTRCSMSEAEAQAMVTAPFESWGLDEVAPLPIGTMVKVLMAKVGDGMAWVIGSEVGQEVLNRKALNLGEEDNDEQPDDGPDGDADVADGPEGPAVVGLDAGDDQGPEGQG